MTPIVFPNTFLNDNRKEKIFRTFGSLAMLSPGLERADTDSRIRWLVPGDSEDLRFESAVRFCRQFAADSMDRVGAYLKGQSKIPVFDPDGSAAIRSEVWKSTAGNLEQGGYESPKDRFLKARVFLEIARDYDEKKHEIEKELEALVGRERLLLEQLQGEGRFENHFQIPAKTPPDDGFEAHMNLRISAWAESFLCLCVEKDWDPGFFWLTTSLETMNILKEKIPELIRVCGIDSRASSPERIQSMIRDLSMRDNAEMHGTSSVQDSEETGSGLVIHVAPGVSPDVFFLRLTDAGVYENIKKASVRNTVICFFS